MGTLPSVDRQRDNCSPNGAVRAHLFLTPSVLRQGATKASNITIIDTLIGDKVIVKLNVAIKECSYQVFHTQPSTFFSKLFVSELHGLFSVCLLP